MSDAPALVYLEADDEITTVVRRLRATDAARVVVVSPGRARATSSAVALRLLARAADEEGREVAVVGDALTRSLAAEAGLVAFGSVGEARRAVPGETATEEAQHATIRVVRGDDQAETVVRAAAPAAIPASIGSNDETVAVPAAPPPPAPTPTSAARPARRRRSAPIAVPLGILALLIALGLVAGATLLPAATVTITPRLVPVSDEYDLVVDEPFRDAGTVQATATVTATGEYPILEPATGVVTFYNFNVGNVLVPAGTLVAAGNQAFETTEAVSVPSGRLTFPEGTIAAGEARAPVVARAPGPAANVGTEAINVVLSRSIDAQLRGFPQNRMPVVLNPEPTSGGIDEVGPEITEDDVGRAIEELRAELARRADAERPDLADLLPVEVPPAEPEIDGIDGLAGTRDQPEVEISGSLAWEVVAVDPDALEAEAIDRLGSAVPPEHELLPDDIRFDPDAPARDGERVIVPIRVEGLAAPVFDVGDVRDLVSGRSESEAEAALGGLGSAEVTLWPGWVTSVPELAWRVEIRIGEPAP